MGIIFSENAHTEDVRYYKCTAKEATMRKKSENAAASKDSAVMAAKQISSNLHDDKHFHRWFYSNGRRICRFVAIHFDTNITCSEYFPG